MGLFVEIDWTSADDVLVANLEHSFNAICQGYETFIKDGTIPLYSNDPTVEKEKVTELLTAMKRVLDYYGRSVELPSFESDKLE